MNKKTILGFVFASFVFISGQAQAEDYFSACGKAFGRPAVVALWSDEDNALYNTWLLGFVFVHATTGATTDSARFGVLPNDHGADWVAAVVAPEALPGLYRVSGDLTMFQFVFSPPRPIASGPTRACIPANVTL